jgi:excisionase family DNA binding protein
LRLSVSAKENSTVSQLSTAVFRLSPVGSAEDGPMHDGISAPDTLSVPRLLCTPKEAAVSLALSRSTVYELMASGELPYVKRGRSRRIRWADLVAYSNGLTAEAC